MPTDPRRPTLGRPVSVLMMDLDHFKMVNDNLGHRAGDTALVSFADQVRRHLDDKHLFARLGGEEFVVLMAGVDLEGCDRNSRDDSTLRKRRIRRQYWVTSGRRSASVSRVHPTATADLTQLVDCADEALYRAKKLDRNRTVALTVGS